MELVLSAVVPLGGIVLCALVAFIAHIVVRKADPRDLPQILDGISGIIDSLSSFVPWRLRGKAVPRDVAQLPAQRPVLAGQVVRLDSAGQEGKTR